MIDFKHLKVQNFFSVGNNPIEINLKNVNITLICGKNGVGKSSITLDAIFFALYGKSFRKVNLPNMINSTNKKELLVELSFSVGVNNYHIKRGIKPNIFEIYVNGVLKPQLAAVKDYQQYLTSTVLKMDEKTFRQLVVVGSTSYIPFMRLSAADRRTVVEDMLQIDIFSQMSMYAKEELQEISKRVSELLDKERDINTEIYALESRKNQQETMSETYIKELKDSLEEKQQSVLETDKEISKVLEIFETDVVKSASENNAKLKKLLKDASTLKAKKIAELEEVESKKLFFEENDACPVCSSVLTEEIKQEKVIAFESKIETIHTNLAAFDPVFQKYQMELEKNELLITKINSLTSQLSVLRSRKKSLEDDISTLKLKITEYTKQSKASKDSYKDELLQYTKQLDGLKSQKDAEQTNERAIQELLVLLKDSGVKAVIIKRYLDIINELVRKYLNVIGYDVLFEFDENFNETISDRRKLDFEYGNLSEGEKLRIDISVMFAFRELSKIRNSISTNILFLDEFTQGTLDIAGFETICEILKTCPNENIFIISHEYEMFQSVIDANMVLEKVNGFTKMKYV